MRHCIEAPLLRIKMLSLLSYLYMHQKHIAHDEENPPGVGRALPEHLLTV